MQGNQLLGAAFLVVGLVALAYGGLAYTHPDGEAQQSLPMKIEAPQPERADIPLWIGAAGAIGGAGLLAVRVKD